MKRCAVLVPVMLLLAVLLTPAVYADFGPKDSLRVYVEHPPKELYYLDLLYEGDAEKVYPNLNEEEIAALHPEMLQAIRENKFGMCAVLADGSGIPTFGSLTGVPDGMRMKHTFGYYGLPDTYRIIIVTESGKTHVSEMFTRRALQSSITYDFSAGTAEIPPVWMQYALQFLCTLLMTLVLEGAVLLVFRFSLLRSGGVFLCVNLLTQIVMTVFVGHAMITGGTIHALLRLLICEPLILIAESVFFVYFMKEHTKARRIGFGITANLVSWSASLLTSGVLYSLIVRIA